MSTLEHLLEEIEADMRQTAALVGKDALDPRVEEALRRVPRTEFVPHNLRHFACDNAPLPIGYGQTISQPYIVALMTDLLQPRPEHVVLEVGTGCGYQAAVLSLLVAQLYSIEIIDELALQASERLQRLGYRNIEVRSGDGRQGWPEHAPYDGIIVTAAATYIPPPLLEQLKPGGRLVIPVGTRYGGQELTLVEKDADGKISTRDVLPVAFVPLTGAPP